MSWIELLAQAVTPPTAPTGAAPGTGAPPPAFFQTLISFGPFIILILVFWLIVFGSKRKQDRERATLLGGLKKGDRVRMIGGEFGNVVEVKDNKVLLKVDETSNAKIWYTKEAVAGIEKEEA